jgi:hypothetical protein
MKVILNTELVKINDLGTEYQVLITMSQGGVLEHEPFPKSLQGLVSAMQLATEICAGKFFPRGVVQETGNKPMIKGQTLTLPSKQAK